MTLIKNTFLQEIYNRKIYKHDYKHYRLTKETYTSTYIRAKRLKVNLLWSIHSGYTFKIDIFLCVKTNISNMSVILQYDDYLHVLFPSGL